MASLQAYNSHGIRYYRIVESFRKEGKPSLRVLAHLGRVDEILRRHQQHSEVPVQISSVSVGAVTALFSLARELDVAGQINRAISGAAEVQMRAGLTAGESMVVAMIARACAPRSKRAFADWAGTTYLPQLMKFAAADLTSQHFWDQMNVMPTDKLPALERALVREVVRIEQLQLQALAQCHLNKVLALRQRLNYVAVVDTQLEDIFGLYERCLVGVIEYLQLQIKLKVRRSVYTAQVVIWLMIVQRLRPRGTLSGGVDALLSGTADRLLSGCERARQKRISRNTGGYSHARQRLPGLLCRQALAELLTRLREILNPGGNCLAYILDGSSLELEASPNLRRIYPPAENQHGRAHWPVLRMLVMHEADTGLAEQPQWGPMYGLAAVSEQQLADRAMDGLKPGSIIIGDRNFGVFSVAWQAQQHGLDTVIRLTNARARRIAGGPIIGEGEQNVCWAASRFDGRRLGGMPEGAKVSGRLISVRIGRGKSKDWLCLFTTLPLPQTAVIELYGKRWHIETDLRSLKRTIGLHHIAARNQSMMDKELLTAMAAYNLVRAVIALAAQRHNLAPRQLSFSFVLTVVNSSWPGLQAVTDKQMYRQELLRVLDTAAQGKHPKRKRRRVFPRAVWGRGSQFPPRKEQKP